MDISQHIEQFLAGMFLCNSIPHLAAGLQGQRFPTPFAKPRGVGESPPLANVFWGLFNLVAGLALLSAAPLSIGMNTGFASALAGAGVLGAYVAQHFGKVRTRNRQA
jgi:hypothetical protein